MNELDKKIREALREEDAEFFEEFGEEPSMFEMVIDTFRGQHRWLVVLTMFWSLVFLGLSIFTAVRFFNTEDPRDMLLWAVAFICCMAAVSMFKLWFWMELNKNAIMREIKRIEWQLARLAGRMKE